MDLKLKHSVDTILDHEFHGNKIGYDALEVDAFLDEIVSDYVLLKQYVQKVTAEIDNLKNENEELKKEVRNLEIDNAKFNEKFKSIGDNENASLQNIDYLRKISILETALYKLGQDPNTIYKTDLDNR